MPVVAITGVSKGIGRALAEEFLRLGCTVCGCSRNLAKFGEEFSGNLDLSAVDVTDSRSVKDWAKHVIAKHGAPDFLINNAAVINRNALLHEVPEEEFNTLIDVNIKGVSNVLREFLPAMVQRRSGIIINMSSGWGRSTDAEVAPYCASKWAIEGLTKALAQELPSGMAAIPLSPNVVNTDMLQSCFGPSASDAPNPEVWARVTAPWILKLGPKENGKSLSAPL